MKPPEQVLRELVGQWITKADFDYFAARQLMANPDPLREVIAFHCQQAAEKYIKAFLVRHKVEFPKTHNIENLVALVETVAPPLASVMEAAEILTPFGVEIRYPGDFPEVLHGQEKTLFEIAQGARAAVMAELTEYLSQ